MKDLSYLVISHTSYADVLDIYLRQNKKYFPDMPMTLAINDIEYVKTKYGDEFQFERLIQYDDALPYGARMKFLLEQLDTPYILVNQDSNVIVDTPKEDIFTKLVAFMKEQNVHQVRLLDAGISNVIRDEDIFHENHGPYHMSAMTAVWDREALLKMYAQFSDHIMRCIECEPIQEHVKQLKNYYVSSPKDIVQPESHCINYHFPTCHVTHLGRWYTRGQANCRYISELANMYGINLQIRGCY
jgi:hypothetical protein